LKQIDSSGKKKNGKEKVLVLGRRDDQTENEVGEKTETKGEGVREKKYWH